MKNLPDDRWKLACPYDRPYHCPKCNHILDDDGFCINCGWDIEETEEPEIEFVCPKCGCMAIDDYGWCTACGGEVL